MPVKIFFCYAHEDEPLLYKLKAQIRLLQWQGLIDMWHDRDISAGMEKEREIKKQLNAAQIILLLVSPDFMASDYSYSVEMKLAMERHERGEVYVIPVLLRPVHWQSASFGKLQVLPRNSKPISTWPNLDEAFFDVAEGIRKVVEKISKPSQFSNSMVLQEVNNKTEQKPEFIKPEQHPRKTFSAEGERSDRSFSLLNPLYKQFYIFLSSSPSVDDLHRWIEKHPIIFEQKFCVVTKPNLDSETHLDFFLVQNISTGLHWSIVKIEDPNAKIYEVNGVFSAPLNIALSKIEAYQAFITENIAYLEKIYPTIYLPKAVIYISRRSFLSNEQKKLLRQFNSSHQTQIATYDRLLDNLTNVGFMNTRFQDHITHELCVSLPKLQDKFCLNSEED